MAIPQNITDENIIQALKYIDQHGIPEKNKSTQYELISEEGKKYPPKYVIAIADHLTNNTEISTENFVSVEAINFLAKRGFNVRMKQFKLIITKNNFESNDTMFDINNIGLGNNYEAADAYFEKSDGQIIRRNRIKNERTITGQTLPRIAFQVFESQISNLSSDEKENFPICQYTPNNKVFRGIFTNENDFNKAYNNTIEKLIYENGPKVKFYIYCWNIFSTLRFIQECLKRFGDDGDKFVLIYNKKEEKAKNNEPKVSEPDNKVVYEETTPLSANDISINTILYGPPGTGKTYNTVLYAVAICDGNTSLDDLKEEAKSKDGYNKIIDRYNELIDQGRIAFTTFHQSYGYEEFVEGIKPEMDEKKQLYYDVKAGCFKEFCNNASIKLVDKDSTISSNITVWKTTIQKSVIKDCFENNRVRIGWDLEDVGANGFVNDMKTGDLILTTDGSRTKINGIAIIKSEAYTLEGESDTTTRDVDWISTDINLDISEFNNGKMLHRMTVARVPNVDAIKILSIKENFSTLNVEKNEDPYVFIIDEINRGNVSKIFGELITLIEDSKRSGRKEAMEVVLPYSGDRFSVPENVYILGTMNTADRSLALMDTALRRRFDFVEMMPDANIFTENNSEITVEGVSIKRLLEAMNNRIEFLYDREHTIGHAYFKELLDKENRNIETLRKIFIKKIIPLLQEYFYDDYERIRLVLGDNQFNDNNMCFIKENEKMVDVFLGNVDIDMDAKTYTVNEKINEFEAERFSYIYKPFVKGE